MCCVCVCVCHVYDASDSTLQVGGMITLSLVNSHQLHCIFQPHLELSSTNWATYFYTLRWCWHYPLVRRVQGCSRLHWSEGAVPLVKWCSSHPGKGSYSSRHCRPAWATRTSDDTGRMSDSSASNVVPANDHGGNYFELDISIVARPNQLGGNPQIQRHPAPLARP